MLFKLVVDACSGWMDSINKDIPLRGCFCKFTINRKDHQTKKPCPHYVPEDSSHIKLELKYKKRSDRDSPTTYICFIAIKHLLLISRESESIT